MTADHILAIDLGTGGPKVAFVDLRGKVVAHEIETTRLILDPPDGAEQDPDDWWAAITRGIGRLVAKAPDEAASLIAVAVTCHWSGTVAVDADGKAIGNSIIWMDSRGAPQVAKAVSGRINVMGYDPRRLAKWLQLTGGAPSHSGKDSLAHILWLKDQRPDVYAATERFLEPADYLNLRLTGKAVTSHDCAVLHWLTDNRDREAIRYDPQLLSWTGLDKAKLPPLVPSATVVGELLAEVAADWGIAAGLPVTTAMGDVHAAVVGCGAVKDYEPHLYLGTSSWLSFHLPVKRTDIRHNMAAFPAALPGKYFLANEHEAAGACLLHARDQLKLVGDLDELNEVAATAPPGSRKLIYLPWLNGERTPVDDHTIRGGWTNLSLAHDRADMLRSILEGVAYNSRWLLQVVEAFTKSPLGPIVVIGGGARSDLWCQIHADVLQRPIRRVEDYQHAGTRGVALVAAVALGRLTVDDLDGLVAVEREFTPDPEAGQVYDELYDAFLATYKATKDIHATLNH
ncbi:MAG TPA: FGGY-family carbohydrate kinase [Acidimicrobiales bacterium]|nr:FGGY-family carbohydrate kinase [Acidimicrobiales bacterium]